MLYLLAAVLCSAVGVVPFVVGTYGKKISNSASSSSAVFAFAVVLFVSLTLVWWHIFYLATPSTVWPLFGGFGFAIFLSWCFSTFVAGIGINDFPGRASLFPFGAIVIYVLSFMFGLGMFRASEYKAMIGPMETRVWTQDVQPKDPKHMRMSTRENAIYVAGKALGQAGAIGSQFQISEKHMTLQMVKGELWYVVPLDFAGFTRWLNANGAPGYIMVHGEDPRADAKLVQAEDGKRFRYMPGAYFSDELERHLRLNGYLGSGFAQFKFEIDDNGKPWWVVSLFEPTIMWNGKKITGILLVDPVSGEIVHKRMNEIPDWVDRVIPANFVHSYLSWYGEYAHGWWNSWWGAKDLTEPENPILIYAADGQPDWVTGITSTNNKDTSLVAVVYTNSRTGKSMLYQVPGGGTDAAVLDAVNKYQDVQFKNLHGADPQIYNVYGVMTAVVPLLNQSHAFQGVAIVNIANVQTVAVGSNQYEALRHYQALLSQSGQTVAPDQTHEISVIEGVVDRFFLEGTTYYLHLAGVPHGFTGGSPGFPKLPLTKIGDWVGIAYYASGEDIVPMQKFENRSLPLNSTNPQKEVRGRVLERQDQSRAETDARDVREKVKAMSPEELRELGKQIRLKKK